MKFNMLQENAHATRAVIRLTNNFSGPLYRSTGNIDGHCGWCDEKLVEHVRKGQLESIIVQCKCGALNVVSV